jgi:hypothetical protein
MERGSRHPIYADDAIRERIQTRVANETSMGSRTLFGGLLAVSTMLLLAAVSLWQVTEPGNAQILLRQGIASATEVDQLLAQDGDSIRSYALAADTTVISVPGYAIRIAVTKDEVLRSDDERLANLLLERSAALVYHEGLGAFDVTGDQHVGILSAQGLLDLLVGRLSVGTHRHAAQASVVLALIWAAAAVLLSVQENGFRRIRMVGQAVLTGGAPGLVLSLGARLIANRLGSDDPFVSDVRALLLATIAVPVRNYAIVSAAAAALIVCGVALGFAGRRLGHGDGDNEASPADDFGFDGQY